MGFMKNLDIERQNSVEELENLNMEEQKIKSILKNANEANCYLYSNELILVSGLKEKVEEKLKEIDEKINGPTYRKIKTDDNYEIEYDLFRLLLKCYKNDKNELCKLFVDELYSHNVIDDDLHLVLLEKVNNIL